MHYSISTIKIEYIYSLMISIYRHINLIVTLREQISLDNMTSSTVEQTDTPTIPDVQGQDPDQVEAPEPTLHELNMAAVMDDARNYMDVPVDQRVPELNMAAVEKDARNYMHVPDAQKTPELTESAVRRDGRNWEHVPEEQKTEELKNIAKQSISTMFSKPVFAAAHRSITENIPMARLPSGEWVEGDGSAPDNVHVCSYTDDGVGEFKGDK